MRSDPQPGTSRVLISLEADMAYERAVVRTQDGNCPVHLFVPEEALPSPAIIMFMDGFGIRPALLAMARRLSQSNYVVLLPDLYYRAGAYQPMDVKKLFATGDVRSAVDAVIGRPTNVSLAASDTGAFLAYLSSRSDVDKNGVGTTGYCMGGAMALTAAGAYPDQVAAAASFHGGNLATDAESSPHLLAPAMRARIYIGAAENDKSYPPAMADRLERALSEAGVNFRSETYIGAAHGWVVPDNPTYNEQAAERHWRELVYFFGSALR
jgi:carboxymethylenebutenolidase